MYTMHAWSLHQARGMNSLMAAGHICHVHTLKHNHINLNISPKVYSCATILTKFILSIIQP